MQIFKISFNHNKIYYIGLILLAISLPLSKFAVSVSIITIATNWVLELDFKRKWNQIKNNKALLVFFLIFAVHVVWLFNTVDFKYALKDISNKAILFVLPLIISTSKKLNQKELKIILLWFSTALLISTLISLGILVNWINHPVEDIRDISPFMSHIRLSLLVNMGIFSLTNLVLLGNFNLKSYEKIIYSIVIAWFIIFLYLLKSFTGIIIFIIVSTILLSLLSYKIKDIVPRLFLQVFIITCLLLVASFLTHSISRFYTKEIVDFENLESKTVNGNHYFHDVNSILVENGNYVWLNVCEEELEKEWNKKSSIPYAGKDKSDQELRVTLTRYLASKGLNKDSVGFSKLTKKDIINIENGMSNYIFENRYSVYPYVYKIIWEIDIYRNGHNPTGNSITQRIEFLKAAKGIIKSNFWFGVGTGDVKQAYEHQYESTNSKLSLEKRLRAHNQYVTFLLTFGIFGFILILVAVFYPAFKLNGFKNYFFVTFLFIALLSFINEDTLETYIGVAFFSYFYSLFLFGTERLMKKK